MVAGQVAIHLGNFAQWTGGVNYLLNMARAIKIHAENWEPAIYSSVALPAHLDERARSAMPAGRNVELLASRGRWQTLQSMLGGHDNIVADCYKKNDVSLVFEAAGYLGNDFPLPVISWLPDFQHRHLPAFFPKTAWIARELRFRKILATRRHLLLSSEDAADDLRRFYPRTRVHVHVVPFAVEQQANVTTASAEDLRVKYNLPEHFLFLPNQFWIHKNHEIVIEGLSRLKGQDVVVAMSGNPEDVRVPKLFQKLQDLITARGLSQNVRILGQIPYADVLALTAAAKALVNPSLFEGWSTTVEEAKSLGTPMILSDLNVHREQVPHDAVFFDPQSADACAHALSHPPERIVSITDAQRHAEKAFAHYGQRLETAFSEILADKNYRPGIGT